MSNTLKIIAIIQARVGGTRLPGKVVMPLGGTPMVENVVERVSRATKIDKAVVAWPVDYDCAENDLISRLLLCARKYKAHRIIRVCADNPCVEPGEIDKLTNYHPSDEKTPWKTLVLNSEDPKNNHDGFGGEYYSTRMLEWMDKTIKYPPYREHPHKFWIDLGCYQYVGKRYPSGFRLDVNTPADYEKLKDIYDHFEHNRFSVAEVRRYLEQKKSMEKRPAPT